jgi:hypothetical protein
MKNAETRSRSFGLASTDDGDALALTFAYPVAKLDWAEERRFDEALQKTEEVGRVIPRAAVSLLPSKPRRGLHGKQSQSSMRIRQRETEAGY